MATMKGNNEQTHSKAQYFLLAISWLYISALSGVFKSSVFAPKLWFLAEETDGFLSSSIRKPMVSTAETSGFYGGNRWFLRRKPMVP
jgi:hypothetical protein